MNGHSKVGASSMHRWAHCPGSVRLCEGIPRKSSAAASEGTAAHKLAELLLTGNTAPKVIEADGLEFPVTAEMREAVDVYVRQVNDERLPGDTVLVEAPFHLKDLHPDLYGTSDCVIWCPSMALLTVMDYKHGAGIPVEVAGNPQLKYYALGALLQSKFPAKRVRCVIVQPRCPHSDGPVRAVEFEAIDLIDFAADLAEAVRATEKPDAPLVVGDWCRFCPALAICPAHAKNMQAMAKEVFAPAGQPPAPATLAPDKIADVLGKAPIVEAWIKAVREYAYTQAEEGSPPPGWKLVDKIAVRKLKADATAEAIAQAAGCDRGEVIVEKFLGIGELERMMPGKNAKERAAALAPFVVKESSGHALAHESDKRPAVVPDPQGAAKLAFQPE